MQAPLFPPTPPMSYAGATASGVQAPLFPPTPPMSYAGATAGYSGTASAQRLVAHPQKQHQQRASHTSHQMGIATQQPSYYSPSVIPQTTSKLPPSNLPRCSAVGCHQKVYYDYELGPFDYCSPECRDRHLLFNDRAALRADIAAFSAGKCKMPPLSLPSNTTHSTQL